jgi:uncharacterized membrane protein
MSVLETFYILFKSDSSDVKKGAEEAKKATEQLDNSLKNVNKSAQVTGQGFFQLVKAATTFLGVAALAHKTLSGIQEANNYALQLSDASRALNVNAADLDAWGNVVKQTGGSVEGFQSTLKGLSTHLGVTAQTALKVLPQLADSLQRMGHVRALRYGEMLGLDTPTILLLEQGRREVDSLIKRQKELGTVSVRNTEDARKYRVAQVELDSAFRHLYLTLAETVIPIFTKFYNFLTPIIEYISRHKDAVIGAFIGIGIAAAIMLAPFIAANWVIIAVAAGIAGLIALFAILYEDVKAFMNGQSSLIGDILHKWPIVGEVVGGIFKFWKAELQAFVKVVEWVYNALKKVGTFFSGGGKFSANLGIAQGNLATAGATPLNSQTSNSIFNNNALSRQRNVTVGDITINTQATDAEGVGNAFYRGLNDQLSQVNSNFDDGVLA